VTLSFSRRLALVIGSLLPIAETIRRWRQLDDLRMWPYWLDDFLIGGFLLYAFWRTRQNPSQNRRFLAAAWGFTCGMGYLSFFEQIASRSAVDPAPVPSEWVAAIKGVGLMLSLLALVGSLKEGEKRA
jgi:peptidoglycan/LPS O-acetylase OafA/YrhL